MQTEATKALSQVTRILNKQYGDRGFRCKATAFGSFVSVRIEDPTHSVTMYDAEQVKITAELLFVQLGFIPAGSRCIGFGHHMDGVVMNWSVN